MRFKLLILLLLLNVALETIASSEKDNGPRKGRRGGSKEKRVKDPKHQSRDHKSQRDNEDRSDELDSYTDGITHKSGILSKDGNNEKLNEDLEEPGREQSITGQSAATLVENNKEYVETKPESQGTDDSGTGLKKNHELTKSNLSEEKDDKQNGVKETGGDGNTLQVDQESTTKTEERQEETNDIKGSDKSDTQLKENPLSNNLTQSDSSEKKDNQQNDVKGSGGSENIPKVAESNSTETVAEQKITEGEEKTVKQQDQETTTNGSSDITEKGDNQPISAKESGGTEKISNVAESNITETVEEQKITDEVKEPAQHQAQETTTSSSSSEKKNTQSKKVEDDEVDNGKEKMENGNTRTNGERITDEGVKESQKKTIEGNEEAQLENESGIGDEKKIEPQPDVARTGANSSTSRIINTPTSSTSSNHYGETSKHRQEEQDIVKTEKLQEEVTELENRDNTSDVIITPAPPVIDEETRPNSTDGNKVEMIPEIDEGEEGEGSVQADEGRNEQGTGNISKLEENSDKPKVLVIDFGEWPTPQDLAGCNKSELRKEGNDNKDKEESPKISDESANVAKEKEEKEVEGSNNPSKLLEDCCKFNYPATHVLKMLTPINIDINILNLDRKDLMLSSNENPKSERKEIFGEVEENTAMDEAKDHSAAALINELPSSIQSEMDFGFGRKFGKKYMEKKYGKSLGIYKESEIHGSTFESHFGPNIKTNKLSKLDQRKYVILDQDQVNVDQKMYMLVPVKLQKEEEHKSFKIIYYKQVQGNFDETNLMSKFHQLIILDENEMKEIDQTVYKLVPVSFQQKQEQPYKPFKIVYVPPKPVLVDNIDENSQYEENESTGVVKSSLIEKNVYVTVNEMRESHFPEYNGLTADHKMLYYVKPEEIEGNQLGPDFERHNYVLFGNMFDEEGNFWPHAIEILKRLGYDSLDDQLSEDDVLERRTEEVTNSIGDDEMQYRLVEHPQGNEIIDVSGLQQHIPSITSNIVYSLNSIIGEHYSKLLKRQDSSLNTNNVHYIELDGEKTVDRTSEGFLYEHLPSEEQTEPNILITPLVTQSNEIRYTQPEENHYKRPPVKDLLNLPLPYTYHQMGTYPPPEMVPRYSFDQSSNSEQYPESLEEPTDDVENAKIVKPNSPSKYKDGYYAIANELLQNALQNDEDSVRDSNSAEDLNSVEDPNLQQDSRLTYDFSYDSDYDDSDDAPSEEGKSGQEPYFIVTNDVSDPDSGSNFLIRTDN